MSKLLTKFENLLSILSYAEKHIFYYIDSNIDISKNQSLTEMAEINNVSTTTIIRMCHKLGLSGYSELKYIIKNINKTYVPKDIDLIESIVNNINLTAEDLNRADLEKLAKMINSSNKVVIVAVGLTKTIGEYFSKLLMQVNKNTLYVYESHIIDLLPNMISSEDLIIFISNSGETKTLLKVAEKLSFRNFKTASIVNSQDSPLSQLVSLSISAHATKREFGGYDITPRSSLLFLIDIIYNLFVHYQK